MPEPQVGCAGTVVGLDACRDGWVACVWGDDETRLCFLDHVQKLQIVAPDVAGIGVDIPIGLPQSGRRLCDCEAKRFLGRRASTVFFAPPAPVLDAVDYASANAACRQADGEGISKQAWNLVPKIRQVAEWLGSHEAPRYPALVAGDALARPAGFDPLGRPVWEVHPEVSFALMTGGGALPPKKSWAGVAARWKALSQAGLDPSQVLDDPEAIPATADDVLDCMAVAWSVRRLLGRQAISLPETQVLDRAGQPWAIWA